MPRFGIGGLKSVIPKIGTHAKEPPPTAKLPKTDYQRAYGRIVRVLKNVAGSFRYLVSSKPKAADTFRVHETFSQATSHQFHDDYHKALNDYKIAAAMEYHHLARVRGEEQANTKEVVIGAGSEVCSTEHLKELAVTVELSPQELCLKYLEDGRDLPFDFLDRALLPYFENYLLTNYDLDEADAALMIQSCAKKAGLKASRDITFERILELKNHIRWRLGPPLEDNYEIDPETGQWTPKSVETQVPPKTYKVEDAFEVNPETGQLGLKTVDPQMPAQIPPALETPGKSRYHLDRHDKSFIQRVVDKGGSLKIPKHDLLHRLKRMVLRNKITIALNTAGIILSTAITSVATGGAAAAINVFIYLGWFAAWSGGTEAVRMIKVVRKMQKMERAADFAINPTDMEAFRGFNEEKFRTFMKCCRYVCSHETLTRIYNSYAELEKDVENSEKISKRPVYSVSDAIKFEESKARYRYRKKNLDMSFDLFNRLYTGAIGDLKRMEVEWDKDVDALWQHKFQKMPPKERARLFRKAAHDIRVIGKGYHFQTDNTEWLKEIFPQMASSEEWGEIEQERVQRKTALAVRDLSNPDELGETDKETINKYTDHVANAVNMVKRGISSYLFGWGKSALKSTISHGFKVGWHGIRNAPYLEITPQLPKISVDGLVIFGFFFVSDVLLSQVNSGVNHYRLQQIQKGKKGKTGITFRERTGREEIATLRKLTKEKLTSFVDTLMSLHDAHKAIMEELEYHKHLNQVDRRSPPFSHMDSYEAAVLILRRKYYEQIMATMTTGAIGEFHRQVQKKSDILDTRMASILTKG